MGAPDLVPLEVRHASWTFLPMGEGEGPITVLNLSLSNRNTVSVGGIRLRVTVLDADKVLLDEQILEVRGAVARDGSADVYNMAPEATGGGPDLDPMGAVGITQACADQLMHADPDLAPRVGRGIALSRTLDPARVWFMNVELAAGDGPLSAP